MVTIEEHVLSSEEKREAVMRWSTTSVWTLPPVQRTSISVEEFCFRTYATDKLESVKKLYIGQFLDGSHIILLKSQQRGIEFMGICDNGSL